MKTAARLLIATACLAALAGAAQAQPYGRGRATLYEYPNFQGRSVTIDRAENNLDNQNFNDAAQSAHFDGYWTVCSNYDFRGRCEVMSGDVRDLGDRNFGRTISSLQPGVEGGYGDNDDRDHGHDHGGGWNGPGGPGAPGPGGPAGGPTGQWGAGQWGGGGTAGRSVVFFPRPQSNGQDIAAFDRGAADWFCRKQGLGVSVYYDTKTRGNAFRWQGGAISVNAPVLRDVVCRRF
jgi:hypothetical protein